MKNRKTILFILTVLFFIGFVIPLAAQTRGLKAISVEDMKPYLKFLGSKEFRGRNAPSAELNIASRYIALIAERIGLKPLMPNGSYYQDVPVEVTTTEPPSRMNVGRPSAVWHFTQPKGTIPASSQSRKAMVLPAK